MTARIVWRPAAADIDDARITAFAREASARAGCDLRSYADLHRWAVENPRQFWSLWADESGIEWIRQGDSVLRGEDDFPRARFFSDSTLNYAQNLLLGDDDEIAIVAVDESGERQTRTFAQLRGEVAAAADFLSALGIGKGDRVAGVLPNRIEAVAAMLATAARGAVWSGCSPDFGPAAIADRFSQIAPKVLFVADCCRYGGKVFDLREKLRAALTRIDGEGGAIENLIVVESDPGARRAAWRDFFSARRIDFYAEAVAAEVAPRYAACGFNDPLWILYSSGTTGKPKCVTHGVGGPLLEHLKEHLLHVDLRRGERILYYTTCGWMMWNWLVSALAARATIVLFDGDPFLPNCESLWDVAAREKIAVAGVSAKYLCALEKAGGEIARGRDLTSLRAVLSTGSPLSAPSYDYFYRVAPPRARLQSISGGTDIVGCFALGHPCLPIRRGEIQCVSLGLDVAVFDDGGRARSDGKGELVCRRPLPSQPLGFWGDAGGRKFRAAYFSRFAGVWAHGDYAEMRARAFAAPTGERIEYESAVIHGRADATLNPGGVRIGTAEIYRVVESMPEILEALAVGQKIDDDDDERILLFVRLAAGAELTDDLRMRIRSRLRVEASPRHLPARIWEAADFPRTVSGKIAELAVRRLLRGEPPDNREALANPESLAFFADLRQSGLE